MAAKSVIAAAVLVAIVAGVWWTRADSAQGIETAAREGPSSTPSVVAPKREHSASTSPDATASSVLDLAKANRDTDLHGVVVRTDGSPVAGATVQAIDYPWRRAMGVNFLGMFEGRPGAETKTDAAGAFMMRLRRGDSTIVRVAADGLATRDMGPYSAGQRVKIKMTPGVTLHVTVRDEAGAPVVAAGLWMLGFGRGEEPWLNEHAMTDAEGKCAFAGLPGGIQAAIAPFSGVGDFDSVRLTLPAGGEKSIDIVSPMGRTLRGRVFDGVSLSAIQGARVGSGIGQFGAVTTDGGGRFEIRGWTGKSSSDLHVLAPGYSRACVGVGAEDTIEIPMRSGFSATGRVVGANGAPIPGVLLGLAAQQRIGSTNAISNGFAVSGADGRFRVVDLDGTMPHAFTTLAPGRGRILVPVMPPREGTPDVDLGDVVLPAPRAIEGVVLQPDGSPSAGMKIRLAGPFATATRTSGGLGDTEERTTDDLGRFRFADLAPGEYFLDLNVPRSTPVSAHVTLPADRDLLDVVLPPKPAGDAIVVIVKDEAGAPLAGINVIGSGGSNVVALTDGMGRAVLAPPAQGKVTSINVGAQDPERGFLRIRPVEVMPGRLEYAVTLERGVRVACRLLDPDDKPVPRASISVEPGDRAVAFAVSDAGGAFHVTLPRDGEYSILFNGGVYEGNKGLPTDSLLEARVDHVTAQSAEVVLRARRVETGRRATVRVLAADGTPVPAVEVRLYAWAGVERKVKTDTEGRARFDDLPAHEFHVNSEWKPDVLMLPPARLVPAGQEVALKFPAAVSVAGSVFRPGGEPAAGASVTVQGDEGVVFWTTADRDGHFVVQISIGDAGPFRLNVGAAYDNVMFTAERPITAQDRDIRVDLTKR